MKTSMIGAGLVVVALASTAGLGYVVGSARKQVAEVAVLPKQADQPPKPIAAAPQVSVRTLQPEAVTLKQQYVGQVHASRRIEVRALEKGYLARIPIKEGQAVKAGDPMFEIAAIYQKARLDAETAEKDLAQLEFDNVKKLAEKQAVSPNEVKLFEAKLARAQAKLDLAKAEFDYATVKAPFDGITGRLHVQPGSLVMEGDILTTLSDNSVAWVYFNVPEKVYLESLAGWRENAANPPVELMLADHRKFPHPGKIGAIEAEFNNESGNIAIRADFPNPDGILHHGQSGRVLINRVLKDAIVVPKRATFYVEALNKRYVYVVDQDKVAHKREVNVKNELDEGFVVETGVGVGDKIVSDEVGKVHDGDKLKY